MKPLVWSYSFLSTYDRCARQGQAKYITKELPYVESKEAAYGNLVHKVCEDALRLQQFPPVPYDNMHKFFHDMYTTVHAVNPPAQLEPEQKLGVTRDWKPTDFFGSNVWGRGKLDAPIILNAENALIFDWKTGKVWEDPLELAIQAVLLKAKYPQLTKIKGCYIWLKEDKYGEVYDLHNMIDRTKDWVEETMEKVGQGLFYAQPNALCGWCDLSTCKHHKVRK